MTIIFRFNFNELFLKKTYESKEEQLRKEKEFVDNIINRINDYKNLIKTLENVL